MANDRAILIDRLEIKGFKSFRDAAFDLKPLNILIGGNGSGKSNLVAFFNFLKASFTEDFLIYVGRQGGAETFLHLGSKRTREIVSFFDAQTPVGSIRVDAPFTFRPPDSLNTVQVYSSPADPSKNGEEIRQASLFVDKIFQKRVFSYHFNDTTLTAPVRKSGYIEDNKDLHSDAGNLAAVLYRIKHTDAKAYDRIVSTVRLIAPFFDDFALEPRALDCARSCSTGDRSARNISSARISFRMER